MAGEARSGAVGLTEGNVTPRDRLCASRVLIIGVGGLGCPAAAVLARAGVGTVGLIDGDVVELSNLPRQVLFDDADIGRPKATAAAAHLRSQYPSTHFTTIGEYVTPGNAPDILPRFQVAIDGTDRASAKYLVNDAAVAAGIPFVHAGVVGFEGQVLTVLPHRTACLRCLFPVCPGDGEVPTCQETGILGPVAGIIGALQAAEALRYLLGLGVGNRLLTCDAVRRRWRTIALARNPACGACGTEPGVGSTGAGVDSGADA